MYREINCNYKKQYCQKSLENYIEKIGNKHNYSIKQSKLRKIKSSPFIYWISDEFRSKFGENPLDKRLKIAQGLATSNNDRFLRYWWEIDESSISTNYQKDKRKWVFYAKGGPFQRWAGNLWTVVNWENDGFEIKNVFDNRGRQRSRTQNQEFYFKEGITYTFSGDSPSFRLLPKNSIFDVAGSSIFPNNEETISYALGLLNSSFTSYILNCLNPTVSTQVGDIKRVPFLIGDDKLFKNINILSNINIRITKHINDYKLHEKEFEISPIMKYSDVNLIKGIVNYLNYENCIFTQVLLNQAKINNYVFDIFDLNEHDKQMVLVKMGESIGNLPLSLDARDAFLEYREGGNNFPLDNTIDFIQTLPITEFPVEKKESIEEEFHLLYQNNNNLEDFCIRHQVNPINIWYWFKQSNVIPKQRMNTLAMEFLADMIREILMDDEDGIIPLVPNAGEKILLERVEEKFREKGFSMAQYSSFDSVLGRPLDEYLNKYFFAALSDHLNLFMYLPKTPFIWHLSSGPEQGFDCYLIIYKWNRDKLMRIRSVYIERRERSLINRQSDLAGNESADAQNEKDKIFKQLKEIESFKEKIDELLAEGYDPILDDGVGKNIAPLQNKNMIPYEVLNPGQLKKYLKADW